MGRQPRYGESADVADLAVLKAAVALQFYGIDGARMKGLDGSAAARFPDRAVAAKAEGFLD